MNVEDRRVPRRPRHPVIFDRVLQARATNALEPEREARFEPRSYGFRPGRSCQDAIEAILNTLRGNATGLWILDADLTKAFDRIDHDRLTAALGSFPTQGMIRGWLKAGVFEHAAAVIGRWSSDSDIGDTTALSMCGITIPAWLDSAISAAASAAAGRPR